MPCSYGSRRSSSQGAGLVTIDIEGSLPDIVKGVYRSLKLPSTFDVDIDFLCGLQPEQPSNWSPLDYASPAYLFWKARQWALYSVWGNYCECNPPPEPPPPEAITPSGDGSDPLTEGSFPSPYGGTGDCKSFFDSEYQNYKNDFLSQLTQFSVKAAEVVLNGGTLNFVTRFQRINPDGSPSNKVLTSNETSGLCNCIVEARDWYTYQYQSTVPLESGNGFQIEFPHSFNWVPLCRESSGQAPLPQDSPPPEPPKDPCSCAGFNLILAAIAASTAVIIAALAAQTAALTAEITASTAATGAAITAAKTALSAELAAAKNEILDALDKPTGEKKQPVAVLLNISNAPQDSVTYGKGQAPDSQKLGWYFWSMQKDGLTYYSQRVFLLTRRTICVAPTTDSRWVVTFHLVDGVTAQVLPFTFQ